MVESKIEFGQSDMLFEDMRKAVYIIILLFSDSFICTYLKSSNSAFWKCQGSPVPLLSMLESGSAVDHSSVFIT